MAAAPFSPFEIACGVPFGLERGAALPTGSALSVSAAFRSVIRGALEKPPCLMSFSGGRDSSALLALAVDVARAEGLPEPIPVTLAFPLATASNEEEWQAVVLDHLSLKSDWQRLTFHDELDAVGPAAQEVLLSQGLVWPFNLHMHLPIVKLAGGGSVVTGFGGDELARASGSLHAERLMAQRRIRSIREVAVVGLRLSPAPLRTAVRLAHNPSFAPDHPWQTARCRVAMRVADAREEAGVPRGWGAVLRDWIWRSRYFRLCRDSFAAMGAVCDVTVIHPFVEGPVLQALASAGTAGGMGSRADLIRQIAGDLLPERTIRRATKASFSSPLWTERAISFARSWSGGGVDERFVDPDRLRQNWLSPQPSIRSTSLLQAAWLHDSVASA